MDFLAATRAHRELLDRQSTFHAWLIAATDLATIYLCFIIGRVANWLFGGLTWEATWLEVRPHYGDERFLIYALLGITCVIAFRQFGHYARRRPFWQELGDLLAVVFVLAIVDAAIVFITKANFSRLWWASSWTLVALLVPVVRQLLKRILRAQGHWNQPTVVIGTGPNAIDTAAALSSEPLLGFDIVAFVRPPPDPIGLDLGVPDPDAYLDVDGARYPVLDGGAYPHLLPGHLGRPHVVVALELGEMERHGAYIEWLNLHHGDVDLVSPLRGLPLNGTHITHFFSHDVLALRLYNTLARPWPRRIKRAFDLLVGSLFMLVVSPLFAVISTLVAWSGGPVFYKHTRIGKGGQPFPCLKFRTMVEDADLVLERHLEAHPELRQSWERDHKLKDDPRVTRIGAWLRRTSLDELPQLINVLKGHMSLVGPRPVVEEELARYGRNVVYYMESTPGLTGLWQVSGRNDLDYRRRVHLDSWYVRNWSLWCDVVILLKTPGAVLRGHGAY